MPVGALERLLAPYQAAVAGEPPDVDPLYEALQEEGGRSPSFERGGGGAPDINKQFWNRFGGDIEVFFGGNRFNPSGVDPTHRGHLHLAAQYGPIAKLLRKIQGMGFAVGEHPKFGGVDPVHTQGSWHYKGRAGDVNYGGGGRWGNEQQALNWLEHWLARRL